MCVNTYKRINDTQVINILKALLNTQFAFFYISKLSCKCYSVTLLGTNYCSLIITDLLKSYLFSLPTSVISDLFLNFKFKKFVFHCSGMCEVGQAVS